MAGCRNRSVSLLQLALNHPASPGVRKAGIKALSRVLQGGQWKHRGWDVLGGATGLKELFDRLSVSEAKLLLVAVAQCRHAPQPLETARVVDELLSLLVPSMLPGFLGNDASDSDDGDGPKRPLINLVTPLLYACSAEFLVEFLSKPPPADFPIARLLINLSRIRADV
jgi:hypothetical protein